MIKVKTYFVPSAATSTQHGDTTPTPPRTFDLELEHGSQVSRVVKSDEILAWAKLKTGVDFTRAKPLPGGRHYEPVLRHGAAWYVFRIWKGIAKNPTDRTRYLKQTTPIGSDVVSVRLERTFGGGPTRAAR